VVIELLKAMKIHHLSLDNTIYHLSMKVKTYNAELVHQ
jgi:hypothetical protein